MHAVFVVYGASHRGPAKSVPDCFRKEDFMAEYYVVTDLGALPGGASSNAYDINDNGQVVGSSQVTGGNSHAFLWRPTTPLQDLGTLPRGSGSQASGISVCGLVAGQSDLAGSGGKDHAFVWSSVGGMQDLGTLPGDNGSEAGAINACGQVVGNSSLSAGGHLHAFIWTQAGGWLVSGCYRVSRTLGRTTSITSGRWSAIAPW